MNHKWPTHFTVIASLLAVSFALGIWLINRRSGGIVENADALMANAHNEFLHGTFTGTTNALATYIGYLERNRGAISKNRRVQVMLLTAYSQLAYMCASVGDTNQALTHLGEAYRSHVAARLEDGLKPLSRTQFAEHVMNGGQAWDKRFSPKWRLELPPNTDAVEHVKTTFAG